MKTSRLPLLGSGAAGVVVASLLNAQLGAQTSAFTYQGQLSINGEPADGPHDLRFAIHGTSTDGMPVVAPVTNVAVPVAGGVFTTTLDFGAAVFDGEDRWLEICARTNTGDTFITLAPRQRLGPVPYAIHAARVSSTGVSGAYTSAVSFENPANSFAGNGARLTSLASNPGRFNVQLGTNIVTFPTSSLYNTAIGAGAGAAGLGNEDSALGYRALASFTDNSFSFNSAFGSLALTRLVSGSGNAAFGQKSLTGLVAGSNNTALGGKAGGDMASGDNNTFVGYAAGRWATNGTSGPDEMVSVGYTAGAYVHGIGNTFVGTGAGNGNSVQRVGADSNTAVGYAAFLNAGSSDENVSIGRDAHRNLVAGGSNVAIGYGAGNDLTGNLNQTFIGHNAGDGWTSGGRGSILLGESAGVGDVNLANHFIAGDDVAGGVAAIRTVVLGSGVTSTTPLSTTHRSTSGNGSNVAGADYLVAPGSGTGNAGGGDFVVQVAPPGASGPTTNNVVEVLRADSHTGALVVSGPIRQLGTSIVPGTPMAALAVDVHRPLNTKSVSADATLTFDATPPAWTSFSLLVTNASASSVALTFPQSRIDGLETTSCTLAANSVAFLTWLLDGDGTYHLRGVPRTIADLPGKLTPVAGDARQVWSAVDGAHRQVPEGAFPAGSVETAELADGAVTAAKLSAAARRVAFPPVVVRDLADGMENPLAFVPADFTITEIRAVHSGTGLVSPSVSIQVRHSTDRSSAGNQVTAAPLTVTSSTTGNSLVSGFGDATVPANSWIWAETSSRSGTTQNLEIVIVGYYD